jgi:hypothetical protein
MLHFQCIWTEEVKEMQEISILGASDVMQRHRHIPHVYVFIVRFLQGEVGLNSQGWQLRKGAKPYRKLGKLRGPQVAAPLLDYSATDQYSVLRNY